MKITVYADQMIQEWFDEVKKLASLPDLPSVIMAAIKFAHTASMCGSGERFVFRNEEMGMQGDIYMGPGVLMHKAPRQFPAIEAELDSLASLQMQDLLQKGFAEDEETAVIRAVQSYSYAITNRNTGHVFGYLKDGDFIPIEFE